MNRCTKIVATIGPASQDINHLRQLLEAGMDVARLNFSHGTHEIHAEVFANLRQVSKEIGRPVTILQDLQGPKIRTGEIPNGKMEIKAGQHLTLTTRQVEGGPNLIPVDFPQLIDSAEVGKHILLDDGNLELEVLAIHDDQVETKVVLGGILKSHKGVNLPGAKITIPGFTEKDEEDLAFGLKLGVDVVAVSFVRSAEDICMVRQAIERYSPHRADTPIIAKLERPEALDNLESILCVADGVMVARGDLGVELSPEVVPIAQKRIIEAANRLGKIVITATQMLDSMINNPRPTRAEASDVANAIFDGTDAVMLSGETAAGKFPIESVRMMHKIVCEAEGHIQQWGHQQGLEPPEDQCDDTYYTTKAASEIARDRNVAALAVFTQSGRSALMMSKSRPAVPILGFTPNARSYTRMSLFWGVSPHLVPYTETIESMLAVVEAAMIASTEIAPGQQVVLICGFPIHEGRPANLALLHTVGG